MTSSPLGPARTAGLLLGAALFVLSGHLFASGLVHRGPGQLVGPAAWSGFGLAYLTLWPVLWAALGPVAGREALPLEAVLGGAASCLLLGAWLSDAPSGPWPVAAIALVLTATAVAVRARPSA